MNEYFIKLPIRLWWITAVLISVNIFLFGLAVSQGVSFSNPSVLDLIHWGADFAPLTLSNEAWRLLSSVFLHIGIVHLLVNMWALYLFGIYAEFYYSRLFYVSLYLIAGLAGNLLSNYLSLQQTLMDISTAAPLQTPIIAAGASGAIMGVGGSLLVAAFWPKADLPVQFRLNKNVLILLMGINLSLGFFVAGINNAAHLGGFIAGVILALCFRLSLVLPAKLANLLQVISILIGFVIVFWVYQDLSISAEQVNVAWINFRE